MRHVPRVYIENFECDEFEVSCFQSFHLVSVLRKKVGDVFLGFNAKQGEFECLIEEVSREKIVAKKLVFKRHFEPKAALGLAFCLLHHDDSRILVEKATELGVTDIYPLLSDHSVKTMKKEKLEKTIIGAVEQSERLDVPVLHRVSVFSEFVEHWNQETLLISAIEREKAVENILAIKMKDIDCCFVIGPAGGFSEKEKAILIEQTRPVFLSKNILRAETAAIACLSIYSAKQLDCF